MATIEEMQFFRRYVPVTLSSDAEAQAVIDAHEGSVVASARYILEQQLATMALDRPFSVPGYSQGSAAENLRVLRQFVEELRKMDPDYVDIDDVEASMGATTFRLVRPDTSRR